MKSLLLQGHQRPISYIQFNPDGDLLFSCGKDGYLNCWLVKARKRLGRYNTGKAMVTCCDVTLDSEKLLAASGDNKIYIFDVASGLELESRTLPGPVRFVEWNRHPGKQDRFVAFQDGFGQKASANIKIFVWNNIEEKYEEMLQIGGYPSKCTRVRWGPFDKTLISTHQDGRVLVWDSDSGDQLHNFKAHTGPITDMTLSEDRLVMLTCSSDCTAALWDTRKFRKILDYTTNRPLNSCAISPLWMSGDNQKCHVAFGGGQSAEDVTTTADSEGKFDALIYHMIYGHFLGSVSAHYSPINCIEFAPDGMSLATGAEEGNVRVFLFDNEYLKKLES